MSEQTAETADSEAYRRAMRSPEVADALGRLKALDVEVEQAELALGRAINEAVTRERAALTSPPGERGAQ